MMNSMTTSPTVAIAVPLEAELVESIRAAHPSVTVLYQPDLLPPERFPADHAGDPDFRRTPEQEERYWAMINQAQVLYGLPNESPAGLAQVARQNPHLQWVQAMAAGAGGAVKASGLDLESLQKFKVTTSAGVHALPLAEFAALGILNGFKRSAELAVDQSNRMWPELRTPTRLVSGSRLVITGLGEIGLETARVARALGMKVSGTKRTVEPLEGIDEVAGNDGLAGLLATADAVVNTLPGTPYTERLFSREIFAAMKPGTVFINVGRGTVVDEDALLEALDNGQVSYACLDVFAVEPLPQESPLWDHPRVMVSPHTSALSAAENRLIAERFSANLGIFLAGGELPHLVDPVHFY
ncbi:2-hydroxyacid dehydrogenase [Arthrobacter sp. ZBG10]|uniref:D-2-hydroxyacid dehydrogenase n=1 Tax=unclassified Arthrobacter TaxID=235627 RepID=UPI000682AFA4|nr:D-2-hydroxyacid dehydrogenase [Arthrobacter sp. Leaf141]KNH18844.1 2-hydroxyacid dehydrogenase [Arthrobacter sp. ZBG10]KQR02430.1 hydroxyacid dehydrogenase [Arthrobacter sp. Leaf141]